MTAGYRWKIKRAVEYAEYWDAVVGYRGADEVVDEFDLSADRRGLDEWLGHCEEDARATLCLSELPEEWARHHRDALDELLAAAERRTKGR